jgi:hypothetical protein
MDFMDPLLRERIAARSLATASANCKGAADPVVSAPTGRRSNGDATLRRVPHP